MIRKIIRIDEEKCNGCGACAEACHEGAIGMVDGKARLLRDDYCDGLGDCIPACPVDAISFEEREAAPYDEAAVQAHIQAQNTCPTGGALPCGCPGSNVKTIRRDPAPAQEPSPGGSELGQWPVQIRLAPVNAPWLAGAHLLVAADCSAYAHPDFHRRFMKNRVTLIGCPKLDAADYTEKLTAMIRDNDVRSVTVVRMEVPCCGGLEHAVTEALKKSGKFLPWQVVTIATDGTVLD